MARKSKLPRKHRRKVKRGRTRAASRSQTKVRGKPKKQRRPKRFKVDPRIESAVREMNRGRSLTATAKALSLSPKHLQTTLKKHRLVKRKGRRWIAIDQRRRKVPVTTRGRLRVVTVKGYEPARLVGQHHTAISQFVQTNDINVLAPFEGKSIRAANGRKYPLETDPNELHRIASMDNPPFHEIYEITSST
jgi:hypothetical protein